MNIYNFIEEEKDEYGNNKFSAPSRSKLSRFLEAIKGKSKTEIRKAEMALLKPDPIPQYLGKKPGLSSYQKRSIVVTFSNEKYIEIAKEFMTIRAFTGYNTNDTKIFESLLDDLKKKKLKWDGKHITQEDKRNGITRRSNKGKPNIRKSK